MVLMVYFLGTTDQGVSNPLYNYALEMFILIAFVFGCFYFIKPED